MNFQYSFTRMSVDTVIFSNLFPKNVKETVISRNAFEIFFPKIDLMDDGTNE